MVEAALLARWDRKLAGGVPPCARAPTREREMGKRSEELGAMARGLRGESPPPGYIKCMQQIAHAIPAWIAEQCRTRYPDLQWHDWGKTVFAGSLEGEKAKYLAASPDAMALLHHLAEVTGGEGTLLQAKVVLESLGVKKPEKP